MTEAQLPEAANLPWLRVIVVGLALWLGHLALYRLVRRLPETAPARRRLLRWLPFLVASTGLAYLIWGVYLALAWDPLVARLAVAGLLAAAVVAAWPAIGDLAAGVVLRSSGLCSVGDRIRAGEIAGTVVALELRTTHLETDDGERILVPHRRLVAAPMVRAPKDEVISHTVRLPLPEGADPDAVRRRVLRVAREHHAVSVARAPQAVVGEGELVVTFFLVVPEARADVERDLTAAVADGGAQS